MSLYTWSQADEVTSDTYRWRLTTHVQQMALDVAALRWDHSDVPRLSDVMHRPAHDPQTVRLWRGARVDAPGDDMVIGLHKPVAVRASSADDVDAEYERITLRRDWIVRRRLGPPSDAWRYTYYSHQDWCHTPSAVALARMSEYFYPNPVAIAGSWPVSDVAPSHPSSGWSMQPYSGGPWSPSHYPGGRSDGPTCWCEGYAAARHRADRSLGKTWHRRADGTLHIGPVTGPQDPSVVFIDTTSPLAAGRSLLDYDTYLPTYYGLPPDLTVAIWDSSIGLEWRAHLQQYGMAPGDGTISDTYTAWQAVPTSDGHSSMLTTIAAPGSLLIDALHYRYAVEVREVATGDPVTPRQGAVWHMLPCWCGGWAIPAEVLKPDGARYWPGWLRYLSTV